MTESVPVNQLSALEPGMFQIMEGINKARPYLLSSSFKLDAKVDIDADWPDDNTRDQYSILMCSAINRGLVSIRQEAAEGSKLSTATLRDVASNANSSELEKLMAKELLAIREARDEEG